MRSHAIAAARRTRFRNAAGLSAGGRGVGFSAGARAFGRAVPIGEVRQAFGRRLQHGGRIGAGAVACRRCAGSHSGGGSARPCGRDRCADQVRDNARRLGDVDGAPRSCGKRRLFGVSVARGPSRSPAWAWVVVAMPLASRELPLNVSCEGLPRDPVHQVVGRFARDLDVLSRVDVRHFHRKVVCLERIGRDAEPDEARWCLQA